MPGSNAGGADAAGGASSGSVSSLGGTAGSLGGATSATGGRSSAGGSTANGGIAAKGGTSSTGGSATGGASTGGGTNTGSICGVKPGSASGVLQMENLCRGVVAVRSGSNNYISWRMMGYEPDDITFNVYRNGTKVNATPIGASNGTNYTDVGAPANATYTVRAVLAGVEQGDSANSRTAAAAVGTLAQPYIEIPVQLPAIGDSPLATPHVINDGSIGDLDGDGEYEIVLKLEQGPKDNSQAGATGQTHLQAYKLSGKRLWDINLGSNIREGAHYTQFLVYDFDGDGKAEVAVKTAPGTRDGTGTYLKLGPAANDSDTTSYRNSSGYVLTGPEYLTVFAGTNGAELATVNFEVPRGTVSSWGDDYGNRVDRFLASVAFVSDTGSASATSGRPVMLMARGYYTRATITAYTYRNGSLAKLWIADSNANTAYAGQGAHSMMVADVDGDLAQEIVYGASAIESNGTRLCSTNNGHGDALHVGDLVPSRPGLEVFMPHEDGSKPTWDLRDARTCAIIHSGAVTGADTGRGVADDVSATNAGAEMWTNSSGGLLSATTGANVSAQPGSANFLIWWDGDESRELQNGTAIDKYPSGALLRTTGTASCNGTKSTPTLTADIFGDWREELVLRLEDNSAIRIYMTTLPTTRRIYTLMHDPQYRMNVSAEQTAYNQPPHTSFHIGSGMAAPPKPNIHVK
jgi:hypothetical protein